MKPHMIIAMTAPSVAQPGYLLLVEGKLEHRPGGGRRVAALELHAFERLTTDRSGFLHRFAEAYDYAGAQPRSRVMLNATAWTTAKAALQSHRPRVDDFIQVTAGQVYPHHPGGGVFVMGRLFLLDHLADHFPLLQSQHLPDTPSADYPIAITREEIKSALAEVERKPRSVAQADDEVLFTSAQDNENLILTLAIGVYGAIRASETQSSEEQTKRLRAMAAAFPFA